MNQKITKEFLDQNPDAIFVFGDNLERRGTGGAAELRTHAQTYGFITKKTPQHNEEAYYTPEEYEEVYQIEMTKFRYHVYMFPTKTFYVSKLGAGLANKYGIYEQVIEPRLARDLAQFPNVVILSW